VAVAGGGTLFLLEVREAVRLRDADDTAARGRARRLGAVRIGAAAALLARPRLLAAALGLPDSGAGRVLPRLVAIREVALGVGAVASSRRTADPWPWLTAIASVDGAEAVVLVAALRTGAIEGAGGWAFVAADLGSASAVLLRATRACRARARRSCCGSRRDLARGPHA
jgi:hypothetical protein